MKKFGSLIELMAIVILIMACHASKKNSQALLPAFDKEGHRGCRGLMPENTIPAMLKAIDLGVTTLEMDAAITKDKQVILSHEPFFSQAITTKPDGTYVTEKEQRDLNIYQMTYTETQQYDVGMKPHPLFPRQQKMKATKPLLSAVIDQAEAAAKQKGITPVFYNIETKCQPASDNIYHPAPEEFVDLLIAVVQQKNIEDRVIIQSFDFRTLQYLHKKYPHIKTAALLAPVGSQSLSEKMDQLGFQPTICSPEHSMVNQQVVDYCREKKIKLVPWTVNDKSRIEELKKMGVDGIITDYPDLF